MTKKKTYPCTCGAATWNGGEGMCVCCPCCGLQGTCKYDQSVAIAAYECLKLLDYENLEGNYDQWTERGISREVASEATEILAAMLREHCPTWPSPP